MSQTKPKTADSIPFCPTHDKPLEENEEDSSKWDCPVCGYGFYLTNPDVVWKRKK